MTRGGHDRGARHTIGPVALNEVVTADSCAGFESWYVATQPRLVATLGLLAGDLDSAQEAADQACARALARWSRVGTMENPGGWTYRVAVRALGRRRLRSSSQRRLLSRSLPSPHVPPPVGELWSLVADLPPLARRLVPLTPLGELAGRARAHSRRRRLAGSAGALVSVALVGALVIAGLGALGPGARIERVVTGSGPPAGSAGRPAPYVGANASGATLASQGEVSHLAAGPSAVYALGYAKGMAFASPGTIERVDAHTLAVTYGRSFPGADDVAVAGGSVWVVTETAPSGSPGQVGTLFRLDPSSLAVTASYSLPALVSSFPQVNAVLAAVPGGPLWVGVGQRLYRVDPATGQVGVGLATGGVELDGLSVDPDAHILYSAGQEQGGGSNLVVAERDAMTGRLGVSTSGFPAVAGGMVSAVPGGVGAWVSFRTGMKGSAELVRSSNLAVAPPSAATGGAATPSSMMGGVWATVSGGALWLSSSDQLACADPTTGAIRDKESLAGPASGSVGPVLGVGHQLFAGGSLLQVIRVPSTCWGG